MPPTEFPENPNQPMAPDNYPSAYPNSVDIPSRPKPSKDELFHFGEKFSRIESSLPGVPDKPILELFVPANEPTKSPQAKRSKGRSPSRRRTPLTLQQSSEKTAGFPDGALVFANGRPLPPATAEKTVTDQVSNEKATGARSL